MIVGLVVHLGLGLVLAADLALGVGPAGRGEVADWLLVLAYAVLTVVVVRGWLFFSWSVIAGPLVVLALLAWDAVAERPARAPIRRERKEPRR